MRHARLGGAGGVLAMLVGCGGGGATIRSAAVEAPAPAPAPAQRDWRAIATVADRHRLREWRGAWIVALAQARSDGAVKALDADPPLYAYDAASADPVPPAGDYRCRTVKLGAKTPGGLAFVAYPFFRCRVGARDGDVTFAKLTGSQRMVGVIYPHDTTRAVFLGTMALGDESNAMRYGRDATRDVAGWVERIGPMRWRVVQPYPSFESTLDVLELVPA